MVKSLATLAFLFWVPSGVMAETREDQALAEPPALFSVETSHTGDFGGRKVDYTANVSNFLLKKDDGSVYAEAVLTSYLAGTRSGSRPVTFIFNGGPGSASTWLHMGLMGPVRVRVPSDASDPGLPPYAIEKNPMALLDLTDLVFIDPIGTGFSRLAGEGKPEDVFGLEEDARSVASIVREWLRRESVGTRLCSSPAKVLAPHGLRPCCRIYRMVPNPYV